MADTVKLGDQATDTVSGFKGVVVGITTFLNGCKRVGIQPKVKKDGTLPDDKWFDMPQLKATKAKVAKAGGRKTGGPMPYNPTRNQSR